MDKFFFATNIPFSVARNAAFKEAVKKTAKWNRPYNPPIYNDLYNKLLNEAKTSIQSQLLTRTKHSIRKFGATLSIDGWSNVTNRSLINAMLISPAGEQFLGSVDTSRCEKNAKYLATVLEKFILEIGVENVMQVTADNTLVNPKAWKLIAPKYPLIFLPRMSSTRVEFVVEGLDESKVDCKIRG